MGYGQVKGRRPFERASKIAHTEVLNNPDVREFVASCTLPLPPAEGDLKEYLIPIPDGSGSVKNVIAIDGGLTEVTVRDDFPSALITFITLGPLLISLEDLSELDQLPFLAPEDMDRLKRLQRYNLVMPTKLVRAPTARTFSAGVRETVHRFLTTTYPELGAALAWLLFHEWLPAADRQTWQIPRCPCRRECPQETITFQSGESPEKQCPGCGATVYLADGLRLYERIDEEQGAGGIMAYLLTGLEQLVLVRLIRAVWELKPALLQEILFVKDGPLAFFGVTAPLQAPMRQLMRFLSDQGDGTGLHLIGLEKSGAFVEHARLIEPRLSPGTALVLDNDYIYKYIEPGDPTTQAFGRNTYYGAKIIFKSWAGDTHVGTIPNRSYDSKPRLESLFNASEVLQVTSRLRCSMYDNALLPVVLANRLVSLADVPSSEILAKFAAGQLYRPRS